MVGRAFDKARGLPTCLFRVFRAAKGLQKAFKSSYQRYRSDFLRFSFYPRTLQVYKKSLSHLFASGLDRLWVQTQYLSLLKRPNRSDRRRRLGVSGVAGSKTHGAAKALRLAQLMANPKVAAYFQTLDLDIHEGQPLAFFKKMYIGSGSNGCITFYYLLIVVSCQFLIASEWF